MSMFKAYRLLKYGEKVPRRFKKAILGKRLSQTKLRAKIKAVVFNPDQRTMGDTAILNGEFCPNCGCKHSYGTGNKTSYPEHWEVFYCLRCHKRVAEIDNSPCYHVLQEMAWEE